MEPAVLSYARAAEIGQALDDCYRCGYPLLGIGDEQACPECGLLARRSRRTTDELHDTRPRWLNRISRGANLILLALVAGSVWPFLWAWAAETTAGRIVPAQRAGLVHELMYLLAAATLFAGTWLLSTADGYPPADGADRRLRRSLRIAAVAPSVVMVLYLIVREAIMDALGRRGFYRALPIVDIVLPVLSALLCAPLPLLIFMRLRGLAKRARSAHLAEHCLIVGIGASCALLCFAAFVVLSGNAEQLRLGQNWIGRSQVALGLMTVLGTGALLFTMWSVYLFVRFAVAFRGAARELHGRWRTDDRSLPPTPPAAAPSVS